MTNNNLPPNATVLSIAPVGAALWLATDTGIWCGSNEQWSLIPTSPALELTTVIASPARDAERDTPVLAGGLPNGIFYSLDDGEGWQRAWTDEALSAVTCFACSPRFAHDRTLLAGTASDGILRSTDGGRRWHLANFGLTGFTILALVAPPAWDNREEFFAATDEGVYRSPNGGRAWKRADCGIEGIAVQTLALSPQFASDRTIYIGSEGDTLYRSTNAGRSWSALPTSPHDANCLWIDPTDPTRIVVGTSAGALLRSEDAGASWVYVSEGADAILSLVAHKGALYAGKHEGGVWVSRDGGGMWMRAE